MREPRQIRHAGWPDEERVAMPPQADPAKDLVATNRSLWRDGRRWIPISGEIHYSRLDRAQWPLSLQLLKAGGVNLVSTYVFWNHHQPTPDSPPDFTGDRDLAAFVRLCAEHDLPVVVRIGPWAHGEARYGGHPDWVVGSGHPLRTDSPGYLDLVRAYFAHLGAQLSPLCGPGGPIIAVQVENELYDDPQHLATIKRLAQDAGITAPLWTATGWGNAQLPLPEVLPVYSGYSEGFWVDAEDEWDASFRSHFFFSDRWDDPGVGKDLAGAAWTGVAGDKHPDFPAATCELTGGMASAYHCRPAPTGLDVAALANVKLGSGSAWQGYYMYVGGTNPDGPDGLQESHATGYPNDLPRFNYDFHAPIGRDLRTRDSFHRLRLQHTFLDAFGADLAGMTTTFPAAETLRWCLRADGTSGFVFVNNHQPIEPLPPVDDVSFRIELDAATVTFPPTPIRVPTGAVWALPVGLSVGGVQLRWATVNLLTVLPGDEPVLVGYAHDGLDAQLAVPADHRVEGAPYAEKSDELVVDLQPGSASISLVSPDGDRLHVLVLTPDQALRAWAPTVAGVRHLLLSDADLVERDGGLVALAETDATVEWFDPATLTWSEQRLRPGAAAPEVKIELVREAPDGHRPPREFNGRASAPTRAEMAEFGAHYRLIVGAIPAGVERAVLRLDLFGDVADLTVAGQSEPFDDLFWDGEPWTVDLSAFAGAGELHFDLRITAFDPDVSIRLPAPADRVRQTRSGAALDAAETRLTELFPISRAAAFLQANEV